MKQILYEGWCNDGTVSILIKMKEGIHYTFNTIGIFICSSCSTDDGRGKITLTNF